MIHLTARNEILVDPVPSAGKEAREAKIDPLIHWLDEVQFYSLGGEI